MKDKHYLKKKKIQLILKFTNRLRKRSIGQILDFKDILIKFVVYIFVYNGGAMSFKMLQKFIHGNQFLFSYGLALKPLPFKENQNSSS